MNIRIESTKKALSSCGGLFLAKDIFEKMDVGGLIKDFLPVQKRCGLTSGKEKFESLCMGFVAGAQCLDDMEVFREDAGFRQCVGHVHAASVYGDFLRAFDAWQAKKLNHQLTKMAFQSRKLSTPADADFILDLDSTQHGQCGEKMEGLAYDYKGNWGLNGIQAFDQYGFAYWIDVRPGNTYTSQDACEILSHVLGQAASRDRAQKRYFRGDSGFCSLEIMNTCFIQKTDFVITMKANMFGPLLGQIENWRPAPDLDFYDGRESEVGTTVYAPKGKAGHIRLVVIRAAKKDNKCTSELEKYDYYAWATSITHLTEEEIIRFYRKRGNAENHIRELKNGFDLHHFPCLKLMANRIYALIAAFAHNIMRIIAFFESVKVVRFAKWLRSHLLNIPAQIIWKSRQVIYRVSDKHRSKILRIRSKIRSLFDQKTAHRV